MSAIVTTAEQEARSKIRDYQPRDGKDYTAKLLMALIDHAPNAMGRSNICIDVNNCTENIPQVFAFPK
jgi:hypothetical protein